jgi:phospholipase/carboxylesterase
MAPPSVPPPARPRRVSDPAATGVRRLLLLALLVVPVSVEARPERPPPGSSTRPASAPSAPATSAPASAPVALRFVERVTGGAAADARLPLVVAVHGLGDRPEHFVRAFEGWPVPARVLVPAAPIPWGEGGAWFTTRIAAGDVDALSAGIRAATDRVIAFAADQARRRPSVGRPVITGFSQGGMIAFAAAALHPEAIAAAVPVGGWLPPPLVQAARADALAPILALHGRADRVVPFGPTEAAVTALRARGARVRLDAFDGVGHSIPPVVHRAWWSALQAAVSSDLPP